jgi:hypothetical protein
MLGGMMNSDTVWREIGRHQQSSSYGRDLGGGDERGVDFGGGFGGIGGGGDFHTGGGF